jgi:hypothetical protein
MSKWEETKRQITESQVWQSIFRHGYDDTPGNRVQMVSGNVWLHLHPSKVRRTPFACVSPGAWAASRF